VQRVGDEEDGFALRSEALDCGVEEGFPNIRVD
jgi:hypothetical protein